MTLTLNLNSERLTIVGRLVQPAVWSSRRPARDDMAYLNLKGITTSEGLVSESLVVVSLAAVGLVAVSLPASVMISKI